MTVKELIEKLEEMPQELQVYLYDDDLNILEIENVNIKYDQFMIGDQVIVIS